MLVVNCKITMFDLSHRTLQPTIPLDLRLQQMELTYETHWKDEEGNEHKGDAIVVKGSIRRSIV
jgi:hypothetical protein